MNKQEPPTLSLTISLPEIYERLCPSCREAFLDLLAGKTGAQLVRDALRRQLDASTPTSCHSERSEEST